MDNKLQAINAAIDYALDLADDGLLFLRMWREGDWSGIQKEYPDFDLGSAGKANLSSMRSVLSLARSTSEGKEIEMSSEEAMTTGISQLPESPTK